MFNKRGPKIETCSTLNSISCQKLFESFTRNLCFLFYEQLWTNLNAGKVKAYALIFTIRSSQFRQSNALEKSLSRALNILPLSNAFFQFSNNFKRHCCGLKSFPKQHWCLENISSKKEDVCLNMLLLEIFDRAAKLLPGLQFCFAYFLPFLCNGIISANLRQDGNKEDLMELLILVHRESAKM